MGDRFPFTALPTGWFQVAYSHELAVGDVKCLKYFNGEQVLFRGEDGQARMIDAYCPHLGAHLGVGGKLNEAGDAVACPFHGWEFNGEGACTRIPYSERIPKQAKVGKWTLLEHSGIILAWHDAAGRDPLWTPPVVPEYESDDWADYVFREWTIRTCNQEMAENAVDAAHFMWLHGTVGMPETIGTQDGHHLHVNAKTRMTTPQGHVDGIIHVDSYGFGFTTTRFTGLVETLIVNSATPIDDESCHFRFAFTVKKFAGRSITRGIGKAFVKEITRQLEQDIPIWENKKYLPRPVICEGDGPIGLFRTWSRQFYPTPEQLAAK